MYLSTGGHIAGAFCNFSRDKTEFYIGRQFVERKQEILEMVNRIKAKGKIFVLAAAMIMLALLAASTAGYAAETDGSSDINRCKLKKSTFFWTVDTSYKTGYFGGITLDLEETQKLDPTIQEDAQYIYANIGGELVIRVTPREGYVLQSLECQPR